MRKLALALSLLASPVAADEVIASYAAVIGQAGLYNSEGRRLDSPAQVLRQDRANVHRFGLWDPGDAWDPVFADARAREAMEMLVRAGRIDGAAAAAIMRGGATVVVTVWGKGSAPSYVEVEVR